MDVLNVKESRVVTLNVRTVSSCVRSTIAALLMPSCVMEWKTVAMVLMNGTAVSILAIIHSEYRPTVFWSHTNAALNSLIRNSSIDEIKYVLTKF